MRGLRKWTLIVFGTLGGFRRDNGSMAAAALAYYTLFSLFPLILLMVAISGFLRPSAQAWQDVIRFIQSYMPGSAELLEENISQAIRVRGPIGLVAVLGFLWSASGIFSVIHRLVNRAWGANRARPFWQEKLLTLGMVLLITLLVILSTASTTALSIIRSLRPPLHWQPLITHLAFIAANSLLFLTIYKLLPYTEVRWSEVWLAALLAGAAWELAKYLFGWYVARIARFSLVYGSVGVVIALLMWAYITGIILLLGAEFSAAYARMRRQGLSQGEWNSFLQGARAYLLGFWPLSWRSRKPGGP